MSISSIFGCKYFRSNLFITLISHGNIFKALLEIADTDSFELLSKNSLSIQIGFLYFEEMTIVSKNVEVE